MAEDPSIELEVTLACNDDTISGTIDDHSGQALAFNGWLELMSAFDTVCTRSGRPQNPDRRTSDLR